MRIRLDPTIPGPLFDQLASSLRASIVDGRVGYGERLPAARELAKGLGINVHTVLRAYRVLRDKGLFALTEILVFVGILAIGLVYVWRKGDLEWLKRLSKAHAGSDSLRKAA